MRAYRRLGRTGFQVSDIVLGSGRIRDQKGTDVVRLALERGVTYIDTSPDYSATGSEEAVGKAIAGRRDRVFLATKFCTPWGHLGAGASVAQYTQVVEDEPPPPRHRLRGPRPHPRLRRGRAADGRERCTRPSSG